MGVNAILDSGLFTQAR